MEDNKDYIDEYLEDFEDEKDEVEDKEQSTTDKALDWVKAHKKELAVGTAASLISLLIGKKLFSKTEIKEVEKLPDPTIMDMYDRIPVEENSYVNYKYVLKDEYKEV